MADLIDRTQRFYKECLDNRNVDALDEFLAEDIIEHEAPPPGLTLKPGREGVKELISYYLAAFKPLTVNVHEQYRDGDTVISRITFHGTHVADLGGIPATGKSATVEGIDIMRFKGDRVVEHWGQFDGISMLEQLGVLPPMG